MTANFISLSLETHLFFARIMKEHSFFLQAGFPCADSQWIEQGSSLREQFEELLQEAVHLSSGPGRSFVTGPILTSQELVTGFIPPNCRFNLHTLYDRIFSEADSLHQDYWPRNL